MTDTSRIAAAISDRYVIERELGAGGMATVYLAHDSKLDREVAVKVLRPELGAILGPDRFLSEIRITARLDHPHILTLIDSGSADGFLYYVMPYVRGESLRERVRRETQLGVEDALLIARQVASALDFAHKHGVIHRDLKPENILLQEGEAMLADFGIALAVREAGGARLTESGLSLGTPGYMSPEQATGDRALDARSDVYSLAAVLYEMLSGEPPIAGATAQAMIARLLTETPTRLRVIRPSISPEIEAAVAKALSKTPGDRFQTAGDFAAALKVRDVTAAMPAASPAALPVPAKQRRLMLAALAVVAIAAVGFVMTRQRPVRLEFGRAESLTTDPGLEIEPDISPQGNLVAYTAGGLGRMRVYVRPINGGRAVALADEGAPQQSGPRWAPDGDRVLFRMGDGVHVAPALGGTVQTLVPAAGGASIASATWSPDGREVAFARRDTLYAAAVPGGAVRVVGTAREIHSCDWSPSGRLIACTIGNATSVILAANFGNSAPSGLVVFPATGGPGQEVRAGGFEHLSPRFLPRDEALLFISNRQGPRDVYAWRFDGTGRMRGDPVRLTTGLGAHSFSVSRDGTRLAYAVYTAHANLWSMPFAAGRETRASAATATEITRGNQVIESVTASADGRWLLYDSDLRGNFDIWRVPIDGGATEQLTTDPANEFAPSLSGDGRELSYHSWRTGSRDIEAKVLDASPILTVTATPDPNSESYPQWSPTADEILFLDQARAGGVRLTRRVDGKWSTPRVVTTDALGRPAWSPDGLRYAVSTADGIAIGQLGEVAKEETAWRAGPADPPVEMVRWTSDGQSIVFKSHDAKAMTSFWMVPTRGGAVRRIVTFPDLRFQSARQDFAVQGNRLYFPVEERESDVQTVAIRRP